MTRPMTRTVSARLRWASSALTGLMLQLAAPAVQALPSFEEVRREHRPSDTQVLDRDGEWLQTLRTDPSVRRGPWVALEDVSPALRTALLLSEDKRFYEHSGVDWPAVSAAAWGQLWHGRTRGASTVTMQLAGLLDGDWRQRSGGRNVVQKLGQTVAAQVLERRWRKDQILEAYLNLLPFRGELVGIDALSRTLFGKAAQGLDLREAAIATALVRAPNAPEAQVARRACGVLGAVQALSPSDKADKTGKADRPDCEALGLLVAGALQRRALEGSSGVAPHWARQVLKRLPEGGRGLASVRSTVRAPLQRFAVQTLQRHLNELAGRHVEDGALVVLDNASGEVLAWVGSSGPLSRAREVDGVLARRQVGSTLKPFLYAQALAERRLTAASLLDDSPAHIPTPGGLYIPQNYDHHFKGWVSARSALASSLNVPAVRVLALVSPDALHRQLRAVGLPLRESGDYYGYSLALGSPELPLLDLSNAYRTLANAGQASEWAPPQLPAPDTAPRPRRRALDPAAAWLVGDILSDPNARARTFGTDSVLATRFWSAVKTGTSKDMRDNWAVGWSQRYTVGVWVGNASGKPMHDVSGTTGAAPVWAELMNFLHARQPSLQAPPPPGLVQVAVRFAQAPAGAGDEGGQGGLSAWLEAPRREWFLAGTEQAVFEARAPSVVALPGANAGATARRRGSPAGAARVLEARIAEPAPGTIVALDPDIPPAHQRLNFRATAVAPPDSAETGLRWRLDGQEVGRGPVWPWMPWPGRHRMQLTNAQGQVLDDIRLEVRGAGLRANTAAAQAARR
ncbi:penicillin-binding protein 1C [Curvibacter lanceolatus]|uniref:penicillin-binding protein 1C n=1 Tax=Curvibacter lanceolatus TaxID=86182 RepID=UPI003B5A39AB